MSGTTWPYSAGVPGSKVHRCHHFVSSMILSRAASLTKFIKTLMLGDDNEFPKDRDSASHLSRRCLGLTYPLIIYVEMTYLLFFSRTLPTQPLPSQFPDRAQCICARPSFLHQFYNRDVGTR